jgi:hypothetical protein
MGCMEVEAAAAAATCSSVGWQQYGQKLELANDMASL